MDPGQLTTSIKFLIRDRAGQFTGSFDAVFIAEGIRILASPPQAPRANAICERIIGTRRRELFDRLLIVDEHHLRRVLTEYLLHYNTARPHRSFGQLAPAQAGTRPPEINLAEYRSAGNKSSADSRTSTRSPPDNPPRLQEESRSRPRSCIRAQQDRFWPSSRSPTPSTPRLALPGRPVHRGSCGIPIRGFLGQPEDQGLDVPAGSRSAGLAAHGPRRPATPDDVAVPAHDRVRGDQEP